jgi:hypothetical protein
MRPTAAIAAALLAVTALVTAQQPLAEPGATAPAPAPAPKPALHLAWMGSGLLFPFYAGAAAALEEAGALVPGTTTHGAMSGGAIVASLVGAGVPGAAILAAYQNSTFFCSAAHVMTRPAIDLSTAGGATRAAAELEACRLAPHSDWRWPAATLRALAATAWAHADPALGDLAALASRTVQVWAAELDPVNGTKLTEDLPTVMATARARPLAPYASVDDLEGAVLASSHLPCLLDSNYYLSFRGRPMVDGGYAAAWPQLCTTPAGGNASDDGTCVRIAATFLGPAGEIPPNKPGTESCDRSVGRPGMPLGGPGWHQPGGVPPNGGVNVTGWGPAYPPVPENEWRLDPKSCGRTLGEVFMSIALDVADTPLGAPWGPPPDINPGKRTPLPLPACEWRTFTRVPPNATVARMIFDHGRAEARAWVDEVWSKQK